MSLDLGSVDWFIQWQEIDKFLEVCGERTDLRTRISGKGFFGLLTPARHGSTRSCKSRLSSPVCIGFCLVDESAQGFAQRVGDLLGDIEPQTHLTQLDLADVSAMYTSDFGKLFLG